MKTVTVEQFLGFGPCYDEDRVREIAGKRKRWTALQVLALDDVPAEDRLWAVLREELIDAPILHEFACWCANEALKLVPKPDPRSVAAIEVKRRWLHGDATDKELVAASDAAWDARDAAKAASDAANDAASDAASEAAWAAAWAALWAASAAAWVAASDAAWAAKAAASEAAWAALWAVASDATWVARAAASEAARASQVNTLIALLKGN